MHGLLDTVVQTALLVAISVHYEWHESHLRNFYTDNNRKGERKQNKRDIKIITINSFQIFPI